MIVDERCTDTMPSHDRAQPNCEKGSVANLPSHFENLADEQATDDGLMLSRGLAVIAIGFAAYNLAAPSQASMAGSICLIFCLFVINSLVQKHQKKVAIDRLEKGLFAALPANSLLWSVVIPVCMSAFLFATIFAIRDSITATDIVRWSGLAAAVSCSPFIANTLLKRSAPSLLSLGVLNGLTIGGASTFLSLLLALFALGVISPSGSESWIFLVASILPLMVLIHAAGLTKQALLKVPRDQAISVFSWACLGALMTYVFGITPDARSIAVATGERLAAASSQTESDFGYEILKRLNAAEDLKIDSAPWLNGKRPIVATLLPFPYASAQRELFCLTGKTPSIASGKRVSDTSDYDWQLGNQAVGAVRPGLSLERSEITGIVDAQSLTSSLYWTMSFGNQNLQPEEARAQILLPPGAVVSRATLWINGVPQEAAFDGTQKVTDAYQWIVQRHRDPLLVTETEPGRILLQAYPVPRFGEMKVRIGITAPLDAQSKRDFRLAPPRIVDANFESDQSETKVKLESNAAISSNVENENVVRQNNQNVLRGTLEPDSSESYQFLIHRQSDFTNLNARATHAAADSYISEYLVAQTGRNRKLAVVLDGSSSLNDHVEQLCAALSTIPKNMSVRIIIAKKHGTLNEELSASVLKLIKNFNFEGGCDDSAALIEAKNFVAKGGHGAVLWIHGPQPFVTNDDMADLKQLMKRGEHRLKIFDYPVAVSQSNQIRDYLADLDDQAAPEFKLILSHGSMERDLKTFISETLTTNSDLKLVREKIQGHPLGPIQNNFDVASRVSTIWAADEARRSMALGDRQDAEILGRAYRVVTKATSAVVLEVQSDYNQTGLTRNMYRVVSNKVRAPQGTADGTSTLVSQESTSQASIRPRDGIVRPPAFNAASAPTLSSSQSDLFQSQGVTGTMGAPALQGATNGTIGPQGSDATYVTGVNTAAEVRVNNMATLEALLSLIANALLVSGIIYGAILLARGFCVVPTHPSAVHNLLLGSIVLLGAVATPTTINWLVATARDLNLFS